MRASFSINRTGDYNAGTHGVIVSGEFDAAKQRRARPPTIQKTLLAPAGRPGGGPQDLRGCS